VNYAIVDIETTGSYANGAAMTEIAIIVTDGEKILQQYETLINPQQSIPYFITRLTGITDAMVASAPVFSEVAEKIYSILKGCIFVAHNVNFDYSFVNHQLKQCGYELKSNKLCTVRYGKKVIQGLRSYSLGNFCKALDIRIENRHRAGGDCMATYYLLKKIFENDHHNELQKFLKNVYHDRNLPLQLNVSDYHNLPAQTGVYYFLDAKQKIIYVGKAINIKKRVASHFAGNKTNKQKQEFIRNIASIKYKLTATELMSLILESIEIKKYWPRYNNAQKKYEHRFAIYQYQNQNGYSQLCIDKKKKNLPHVITVKNKVEGFILLKQLTLENNLCPNKCQVDYLALETDHKNCNGVCECHKTVAHYNTQLDKAVKKLLQNTDHYFLVEDGFKETEKSVILVEEGIVTAFGYTSQVIDKANKKDIVKDLEAIISNNYINSIVQYYAKKNEQAVVKL
jgi:DNA polymerase III subunit epsilon